MEPYNRSSPKSFPDYLDRRSFGILAGTGFPFENVSPRLVNNPITWTDTLDGYKNPKWRVQVKRQMDATTTMTATSCSVVAEPLTLRFTTSAVTGAPGNYTTTVDTGYPHYGPIPSLDSPTSAILSAARNHCIRQFLRRARDARSSVEGQQALGEWKQTVRALTNPLSAMKHFTLRHVVASKKKLRRYKDRRGKDFARALAGTYLEFNFGWIPLANDVRRATEGLLDRFGHPDTKTISAIGTQQYNASVVEDPHSTIDEILFFQNRSTSSATEYRIKACIETGAVNGVRSVPATLGLLPERFVPTVWELIPYSFVIDYFLNIGEIIEAVSFRRSIVKWGYQTQRTWTETRFGPMMWRYSNTPPNYYPTIRRLSEMEVSGGRATLKRKTVNRVSLSTVSLVPDLTIQWPNRVKPWVNIAALLTQKFCSL